MILTSQQKVSNMLLQKLKPNFKQRGIGLLELMLGMTIIAIMIILATRYYQSAKRSQLVNQAVQDINSLRAAAVTWSVNETTGFMNLTMEKLKEEGLLPSHMSSAYPDVKSAFGTDLTISQGIFGGQGFTVSFRAGTAACNSIVSILKPDQYLAASAESDCSNGDVVVYVTTMATFEGQ